jgi:CRISPR-associated helicase Cas3
MAFKEEFEALTGNAPYPWQGRLFLALVAGDVPRRMSLPTGAGKTSIIPVWLCAIWHQLELGQEPLSRRLYFAVDRRVVVDQSETVAQEVVNRAKDIPLWDLLKQKTLNDVPLLRPFVFGSEKRSCLRRALRNLRGKQIAR